MSVYPDDYDNLHTPPFGATLKTGEHSRLHAEAKAAIEAIQRVLGLTPQGIDGTVADRLGDLVDATDLPIALHTATPGYEFLSIQDEGLVREDVGHVLSRPNHTGTMPYSALGAAPALKLRSAVNQSIPNDIYNPISFDTVDLNQGGLFTLNTSSTTITSGSNGVALPTGTINVVSTTGFDTLGSLSINGPPGSGISTRVEYTGKTGTTFTGCTVGNGTLATGQVVKPSNETITLSQSGLYLLNTSTAFNAHATGQRAVRFAIGAFFAIGELKVPTTNTVQNMTTSTIIDVTSTITLTANAYQNSGAALTSTADILNAPNISIVRLGA